MAIQLARAVGARVAVTAGTRRRSSTRCRELGAEILVNYRERGLRRGGAATRPTAHGADVILDNMGAKYLARNVDVLAVNGRLVVDRHAGRHARPSWTSAQLMGKRAAVHRDLAAAARPPGEKAAIVAPCGEHVWPLTSTRRRCGPIVDRGLPMPDAAEAHRLVEASEHIGKVLLTVGGA